MSSSINRVAIIGAGIAGLSMAACLRAFGQGVSEVVVFDPHDVLFESSVGGVIGLNGGLVVLQELGLMDVLRQHSHRIDQVVLSHRQETLIKLDTSSIDDWTSVFPSTGLPLHACVTRWNSLRKILHDSCLSTEKTSHQPMITFRENLRFLFSLEDQTTGKLQLHFAGGQVEGPFDLLIGADGSQSTVRNFTEHGNSSILSDFSWLSRFFFNGQENIPRDTGLRVLQCLSMNLPISDESVTSSRSAPLSLLPSRAPEEMPPSMRAHEMHHWLGKGLHAMSMPLGGAEHPHNVIVLTCAHAFHEKSAGAHNTSWQHVSTVGKEGIHQRLLAAGFDNFHDLHGMLEAICQSGGGVFMETTVFDLPLPLRSWSSRSGRVILIGDSAHITSPFLGQGANQALQDSCTLSKLIGRFNAREPLHSLKPVTAFSWKMPWLMLPFRLPLAIWKWVFDKMHVRAFRPGTTEEVAYEFERRRKFHVFLITLLARLLGLIYASTSIAVKVAFFHVLSMSGFASWLFFKPLKPVM